MWSTGAHYKFKSWDQRIVWDATGDWLNMYLAINFMTDSDRFRA